jgi:WbqC-like protein family
VIHECWVDLVGRIFRYDTRCCPQKTQEKMTIAIHQPNYFPWLGFFAKMNQADTFVFLDTVQFSKGSYTNRCRVYDARSGEARWMTVPVSRVHSEDLIIKNIKIDESRNWRAEHTRKLKEYYHDAPFAAEYLHIIAEGLSLTRDCQDLSTINQIIVMHVCKVLGLAINCHVADEYTDGTASSELLANIVRSNGGSIYMSGKGGANYLQETPFKDKHIEIRYSDFAGWTKESGLAEQMPRLANGYSIIDSMMYYGIEKTSDVLHMYKNDQQR